MAENPFGALRVAMLDDRTLMLTDCEGELLSQCWITDRSGPRFFLSWGKWKLRKRCQCGLHDYLCGSGSIGCEEFISLSEANALFDHLEETFVRDD